MYYYRAFGGYFANRAIVINVTGKRDEAMKDLEIITELAEKVMGWDLHTTKRGNVIADMPSGGYLILCGENPIWNPLSSDADCLAMVDAVKIQPFELKRYGRVWSASFGPHRTSGSARRRSICFAALLATPGARVA